MPLFWLRRPWELVFRRLGFKTKLDSADRFPIRQADTPVQSVLFRRAKRKVRSFAFPGSVMGCLTAVKLWEERAAPQREHSFAPPPRKRGKAWKKLSASGGSAPALPNGAVQHRLCGSLQPAPPVFTPSRRPRRSSDTPRLFCFSSAGVCGQFTSPPPAFSATNPSGFCDRGTRFRERGPADSPRRFHKLRTLALQTKGEETPPYKLPPNLLDILRRIGMARFHNPENDRKTEKLKN